MHDVAQITRAIASGDPEAVALLYEARFDFVYRLARSRSGLDEFGSMDVLQDAFLKAVRSMKVFRDAATLDAWLARVVTSVAYDHLRRERRRRARERSDNLGRHAPTSEQGPRQADEQLEWLRRELQGLDRLSADLIDMRFRMGLTLAAIGERVGLGPGAVDGRIRRSLKDLRDRAKERDDA